MKDPRVKSANIEDIKQMMQERTLNDVVTKLIKRSKLVIEIGTYKCPCRY